MAENKGQRGAEPAKPESASKPAKRAYEERERASEECSGPDAARGEDKRRDAGEAPGRAPEAERKGGRR